MISNDYFLFTICSVKEQNRLCCIIISYCELKLKLINTVFVLKREKSYETVEYINPGKMMLLHGITDNILISHPYYSRVYQD